jgi:hypothetical protein
MESRLDAFGVGFAVGALTGVILNGAWSRTLLSYKRCGEMLQLDMPWANQRIYLRALLNEVADATYPHLGTVLPSIVVREDTGIPGGDPLAWVERPVTMYLGDTKKGDRWQGPKKGNWYETVKVRDTDAEARVHAKNLTNPAVNSDAWDAHEERDVFQAVEPSGFWLWLWLHGFDCYGVFPPEPGFADQSRPLADKLQAQVFKAARP